MADKQPEGTATPDKTPRKTPKPRTNTAGNAGTTTPTQVKGAAGGENDPLKVRHPRHG